MKTTVLYHSADFDGIFCREIARHFLGDKDVEYIGWNFGDQKVSMPTEGHVYILDLSPECLDWPLSTGLGKERMIWIDHHKTSIAKFPTDIPGYRIDGVAACRLAWQWFTLQDRDLDSSCEQPELPDKQAFIDRRVDEPLAVQLAGEYDVAGPGASRQAVKFQYGIRSTELAGDWNLLLDGTASAQSDRLICDLLDRGVAVLRYQTNLDIKGLESAFTMEWEGVRFLAVNGRANSDTFTGTNIFRGAVVDAVLGFKWAGKEWVVSLYHAKHRTDLDLSTIAVKHGGGGHRGACGFTCKQLPFSLV